MSIVLSVFQQMRCKTISWHMWSDRLSYFVYLPFAQSAFGLVLETKIPADFRLLLQSSVLEAKNYPDGSFSIVLRRRSYRGESQLKRVEDKNQSRGL